MSIHYYHPSKSGKGHAFQVNVTEDFKSIYFTLIRQAGQDEKGNGTFKDNVNNPEQRVNVKLNHTESAAIVNCMETGVEFSTYHDSDQKPKQIKFSQWINKADNTLRGYSLYITVKDKQDANYENKFLFGFTLAESRLLKEFLLWAMKKHFKQEFSVRQIKSQWAKPMENAPKIRIPAQPLVAKTVSLEKAAELAGELAADNIGKNFPVEDVLVDL